MATYTNNLRLKEITTGDEDGTWGVSTNTNLDLIADALGYSTQNCFTSDADATTTVADGAADPARALYFKVTSSATLTGTRTLTIAPNTVSRVMFIENATTGSQSIQISQGSGSNVTVTSGRSKLVYLDGAGASAAVVDISSTLSLATGPGSFTTLNATGGGSLTGTWSNLGSVTTVDINGGTVDGVTIGGSSAGAGTFTTLNASGGGSLTGTWSNLGTVTTVDINGGTVDGTAIGGASASTGNFSTLSISGVAITSTATELNVLDGITATTAELNYTDGVTSNIQTQLNAKAPIASPTFTGTTTIPTVDINGGTIDGVTIGGASAAAGTFTTLADQDGSVRAIPPVGTKTGSYTLTTSDVGQYVQVGSGGSITIPNATFSEGDAISIFNNTTGNITITCSITTAYIAGRDADKASVTLDTRGVATILFISGTVCVITGNVS